MTGVQTCALPISSYDSGNPYGQESHDSTATDSSTESASATLGAESTTATLHLTGEPPEGTVASGSYNYEDGGYDNGQTALYSESSVPPADSGPIHDLAPQHHEGESGMAEPIVKS